VRQKSFMKNKEELFLGLYKRRLKYVLGYCRNNMRSDPTGAEDMAQEIFMQVYNSLDKFRGDCEIDSWLYRVMRNYCKNRYRWDSMKKRDGIKIPIHQHTWTMQIKDRKRDALSEVISKQLIDGVFDIVHSLDEIQRDALMAMMNNDSYKEAAKNLGIPINTLRSRLGRARAMAIRKMKAKVSLGKMEII